ncbi:MAG: hypothetical protein WD771_07575 [Gemmatimonadaceae bacterium]
MAHETQKPKVRTLVSAVLDDGSIVETLAAYPAGDVELVRLGHGHVEQGCILDLPQLGQVRAYSADNNLIAHGVVKFPSGVADYESEMSLIEAVSQFIHRYADLSPAFEEAAAHYVLLTWIYDAFNELPYLRLKGDFGSGKTRCLQTIGALCYKPMFASGASTVSPLFRIIDEFRGTLIMDESDFRLSDERAEIVKILNNGNAKGFPVLRSEATPGKEFNPRAFAVYGPKVIATRRSFEDRALESRCITEEMVGLPPRDDIPLSLPEAFHEGAIALQNQLLMYRVRRRHEFGPAVVARAPHIEARVAQVFAPLLAVAVDDEARERLHRLAETTSWALKAERGVGVEAQLLDIIAEMRRESVPLGIKEIASRFGVRFGFDFGRPVTPRWVGHQLRTRLGLRAVKSNGSFVIHINEEGRLQALFQRYGTNLDEQS